MNMRQAAAIYVSAETLNISDLEKVSVDVEIEERVFKEGTKEEFKYKVAIIDKKEYRVPNMVLGNLKEILNEFPQVKEFKVLKKGEGMNTRYTVIPLGV